MTSTTHIHSSRTENTNHVNDHSIHHALSLDTALSLDKGRPLYRFRGGVAAGEAA